MYGIQIFDKNVIIQAFRHVRYFSYETSLITSYSFFKVNTFPPKEWLSFLLFSFLMTLEPTSASFKSMMQQFKENRPSQESLLSLRTRLSAADQLSCETIIHHQDRLCLVAPWTNHEHHQQTNWCGHQSQTNNAAFVRMALFYFNYPFTWRREPNPNSADWMPPIRPKSSPNRPSSVVCVCAVELI